MCGGGRPARRASPAASPRSARTREGIPVAKAGLAAAGLWILGTGGRLAFQVYATHGGGAAVARFSTVHSITSVAAWTDALILMALCEAVVRTGILGWRAYTVRRQTRRPPPSSHPLPPVPPAVSPC